MAKSPTRQRRQRKAAPKDVLPSSVRMPPEIDAAVRRVAEAEDRSISSLVVHVLRTWLTEHGHLPKGGVQPKPRRAKT
jgi:hypothetical protein